MQEDLVNLLKYQANYLNAITHLFRELQYETELNSILSYSFTEPNNKTISFLYDKNKTVSKDLNLIINGKNLLNCFSLNNVITLYNLFYTDFNNNLENVFTGQGYFTINFINHVKELHNET